MKISSKFHIVRQNYNKPPAFYKKAGGLYMLICFLRLLFRKSKRSVIKSLFSIFRQKRKVFLPTVFSDRHRLFIIEKEHQRGTNRAPGIHKRIADQMTFRNQSFVFGVIVEVHKLSMRQIRILYF